MDYLEQSPTFLGFDRELEPGVPEVYPFPFPCDRHGPSWGEIEDRSFVLGPILPADGVPSSPTRRNDGAVAEPPDQERRVGDGLEDGLGRLPDEVLVVYRPGPLVGCVLFHDGASVDKHIIE